MKNTAQSSLRGLIFGTLTAWVLAVPALAQKPAAIDPKAQEMLRQSAATYAVLRSYSCQVEVVKRLSSAPGTEASQIKMALQRPDCAAVTIVKDGKTEQYSTQGRSLFIYSPNGNQFAQEENKTQFGQPKTAPVLNQGSVLAGLVLLEPSILTQLASAIGTKSLMLGPVVSFGGIAVRTVTQEEKRLSRGRTIYRVTLGVKDHLIYRYDNIIQSPKDVVMGVNASMEIDNTETYTNIQINPVIPAAVFLPPAGAKKTTDIEAK